MQSTLNLGIYSLLPLVIALLIAFKTRSTVFSLFAGCVVGVAMTFVLTALFSFATGTSWGAYALMIPLSLPMAYSLNGGVVDSLLLQTVAAIAGGGIFGDHASPVSDTSILASTGAGSDHMDHVITQLPYALTVAIVTTVIYIFI